ncbi:Site-specific recombinase XerD [Nitrosomonas nitrosa]|uniref:Site-specific recombinase XerD n=1 Tax=Nitrosomonas nitrosa TaxID=52442 RepID=A0A8H8YZY9_9PROT|nr:site-specific integrase [Nitrosomonas nitrosa]CAE6505986.1 Site-specific recombinase XerD [Nitrosomonas nitrosa]
MPIVKLSESFVRNNLQCPEGNSRIEYCDQDTPGLYIEVRATSPKEGTIYLRYKDISGITRHQKIARTTEITLAEARRQAKTLKAEIALGKNLKEEGKPKQSELTYEQFFEHHYVPHKSPHKRSISDDIRIFRLKIQPTLGHKLLHQITRIEIQALLTSYRQTMAPASCNHILKVIKHSLNLAVEWEFLEANPATRIPLFHEDNIVENYLNDDELERLLTVLRTDENRTVCNIALFLLSTGLRLQEAMSLAWVNVDLEKKILKIRAINSKSKRLRSVPLNETAMEVLNQLDTRGKYEYLFINRQTGKPYTTITKVWQRLRSKAGLGHLRLHDLRHAFASFLVNSNFSLFQVQQILGHSDPKVTMRYAHLSTKALQEAANSASAKIKKAMQPKVDS